MRTVLVTGASSGIGKATATYLAAHGWRVLAGVRTPAVPGGLIEEIRLDVTQDLGEAVETVRRLVGTNGLQALVNNAGIGDIFPLEFTSAERFRRVFDVNVFGLLAVTQAVLPDLHRGRGRIVNMGSIGGRLTIPLGGALTASKHAVEAISDALRMELFTAGIPVTCLEPASINSGSAEKLASAAGEADLPEGARERYSGPMKTFVQRMLAGETSGSPPEVVARAVFEILEMPHPPARKVVGRHGLVLRVLARWVPDAWREALLRRLFLGGGRFGSRRFFAPRAGESG